MYNNIAADMSRSKQTIYTYILKTEKSALGSTKQKKKKNDKTLNMQTYYLL